jgi:hypothetical protein
MLLDRPFPLTRGPTWTPVRCDQSHGRLEPNLILCHNLGDEVVVVLVVVLPAEDVVVLVVAVRTLTGPQVLGVQADGEAPNYFIVRVGTNPCRHPSCVMMSAT